MLHLVGILFIAIGLAFDFISCVGLVRLPDVYNRLQSATKCVTLGTCSILFGVFLLVGFVAAGLKALLCIGFLVLTAPVSAHAPCALAQQRPAARGPWRARRLHWRTQRRRGAKKCVCLAYPYDEHEEHAACDGWDGKEVTCHDV